MTAKKGSYRAGPYAVYWLYGDGDVILYIGMTGKPQARLANHKHLKPWWPLVVRHKVHWLPTYDAAKVEETRMLRRHRPPHNLVIPEVDGSHITRRGGRPQLGRRIVNMIGEDGEVNRSDQASGQEVQPGELTT